MRDFDVRSSHCQSPLTGITKLCDSDAQRVQQRFDSWRADLLSTHRGKMTLLCTSLLARSINPERLPFQWRYGELLGDTNPDGPDGSFDQSGAICAEYDVTRNTSCNKHAEIKFIEVDHSHICLTSPNGTRLLDKLPDHELAQDNPPTTMIIAMTHASAFTPASTDYVDKCRTVGNMKNTSQPMTTATT